RFVGGGGPPSSACLFPARGCRLSFPRQAVRPPAADPNPGPPGAPPPPVGAPRPPPVRPPVLPGPQRLLEPLLVQPDLARQPRQHVDLADVLALHEERLQDPGVVVVALAVLLGVLVALERQVRVRLRRHPG